MDIHEDCNKHGQDFNEDEKRPVEALVSRLRLQPEDIGGPSRMDMLRERKEAATEIERQADVIRELQAALMDAIDWNWLDEDRPDDLYSKYYVLAGG